jgi:hypothetical protein
MKKTGLTIALAALLAGFPARPARAYEWIASEIDFLENVLAPLPPDETHKTGVYEQRKNSFPGDNPKNGQPCAVIVRKQTVFRDTGNTYSYGVEIVDLDPASRREHKKVGGFFSYQESIKEGRNAVRLTQSFDPIGATNFVSFKREKDGSLLVRAIYDKPLLHDKYNPLADVRPSDRLSCRVAPPAN